jgi:hypothetical protein
MALDLRKNFARGLLAADITAGATQIVLNPGQNLPTTAGSFPLTIWDHLTYPDPAEDINLEIVTASYAGITNTFNIVRAQEGTSAVSHSQGNRAALHYTAQMSVDDLANHEHAASAVISGQFVDSRISESSVTQHEGAIDHGFIAGLLDDDHIQYHTDGRANSWLAAGHETTYTHSDIALNTIHRGVTSGNPHNVTVGDIGASPTTHRHDTETLEHDAVNSDGGAFSFTTTGLVTFNQRIASANYEAANKLTAAATNAGELDFIAASKKLDVEDNAIVDQDYSSDASPTFATVDLTGVTDGNLPYMASGAAGFADSPLRTDGTDLISTGVVQATEFAKTGWPKTPGVTLSFDNASKVFTVTDGGSAYYYIQGVKYVLGGNKTVDLDTSGAAEGSWFIYFVGSILTASQTPWVIKDEDKAFVAYLYWDNTNNKEIFLGYELHSFTMDGKTHHRFHDCGGAAWSSGLLVADAGSEQINISAGEFHDEDIDIIISDGAGAGLFEQVLSPAELPIYYRSGASDWRIYEKADKANVTDVGYIDGGNALHYNKLNGTWASVATTVGKHVAYYVVATNDQTEPVCLIMGQRTDNLLAQAKENNVFSGLVLAGMPFQELVVVARVIVKNVAGSPYYSIEDITDLRATNAQGNVTSPLITDHGGLGGLADDDHAQYLLADGTRALVGAWDMGSQALTNVNMDTGDINVAVVNTEWDAAYTHSQVSSGNPHSVTPTELSLVIGTDVLAEQTIGIADNNLVEMDDADAADDDYAKFTANGLEGRSYSEVLSDLSGQASSAFDMNGQDLINGGVLILTEQAAAEAHAAGKGQFWVKTATPNEPWFDNDAGTEIPLDNRFVHRGDPATADWHETGSKAVLNTDNTWRDLDCSSIVPANAVAIMFSIIVEDDAASSSFAIRKNGNSNVFNAAWVRTQVANVLMDNVLISACDENQVVEYKGNNVAFSNIYLTVMGWWLA